MITRLLSRRTATLSWSLLNRTKQIISSRMISSESIHDGGDKSSKKTFITTPIFYVNAKPHIGHLYSALLADVSSRWRSLCGDEVVFSSGTDEHGLKIQQAAEASNINPLDFCDNVSLSFQDLFTAASINPTRFIRTTEPDHIRTVNWLWKRLVERGHIYLGSYNGWYCMSDEAFVPEKLVTDGPNGTKISMESGNVVEWVCENNYKFALDRFIEPLREWLVSNPSAIQPSSTLQEVLSFLDSNIGDLSVSRPRNRLNWGIPVPDDDDHIIYVWLDALSNYLTVAGFPPSDSSGEIDHSVWPADHHIIGKDIVKFHTVYWPAFLLAAGIPLPKQIVVHGHWTKDHFKMSKSRGNIVDPFSCLSHYGIDQLRYVLMKEGVFGGDADFSDRIMTDIITVDLISKYGNLGMRCSAPKVNIRGVYPSPTCALMAEDARELTEMLEGPLRTITTRHCNSLNFGQAIRSIMEVVNLANAMVQHEEPWVLAKAARKGDAKAGQRLDQCVYLVFETMRIVGTLLSPIMPHSSNCILSSLGVPEEQRTHKYSILGAANKVICEKPVDKLPILFQRYTTNRED